MSDISEISFYQILSLFVERGDTLGKNDYISMCKLKEISNLRDITIELTHERDDNTKNKTRTIKYGNGSQIVRIGLLAKHYFINEETKFTHQMLGLKKQRQDKLYLTSYQLIKLLLKHKEKFLEPITYSNCKKDLNYEYEDLKNYVNLYAPKVCTKTNKCKFKCECGSEVRLVENKSINPPKIFYIKKDLYMKHEVAFFDFEATTDGNKHEAYQIAFQSRNSDKKFFEGEFCALNFLKSIRTNYILYAHNLKYDLQFIMKYLCNIESYIKTGSQVKTISGQFYNKDTEQYYYLCFKDSCSLIPMPLNKFGKIFKLKQQKEILPYELYTNENIKKNCVPIVNAKKYLSKEDYEQFKENIKEWNLELPNHMFNHIEYSKIYCEMDVEVLKNGYEIFKQWMYEITKINLDYIISLPQLAYTFGINEGVFNDCYELSGMSREFIMRCMVGGRTMTNSNKKYHIKEKLQDFDAVSLYPSAMDSCLKGLPKVLNNEQLNMDFLNSVDGYFIEVNIKDIKTKREFPLISKINKEGVRDYSNDIRGSVYLDKIALEDAIKFQNIEFEIIRGYYYNEGRNNELKEFIKNLFNERLIKKNEGNPIQECYKLIMNSFYGKTIQNPINKNYRFLYGRDKALNSFLFNASTMICATKISNELFMLEEHKSIQQHFSLPHIGIEILSKSKRIMNEVMTLAEDLNCKIYYQDTDSMHIQEDKIELLSTEFEKLYNRKLIGKNMGQFHCDFDFKSQDRLPVAVESYFLGKKCYIDKISCLNNGIESFDYHIRMKGIPSSCIKNFQCENLTNKKKYNNVIDIYSDLYKGNTLEFELIEKKFFKYNKNFTYSKYDEFKRKINLKK